MTRPSKIGGFMPSNVRGARLAAFLAPVLSLAYGLLAAQELPAQERAQKSTALDFAPAAAACTPFFPDIVDFQDQDPSSQTGDFNGDGIPDLVVLTSRGLRLLIGLGNGRFQPPVVIATGLGLEHGPVVGDFNHDGKLDIAVSFVRTQPNGAINVYLGNGDGTFQPPMTTMIEGSTMFLAVGDFNGDGNLDLAAIWGIGIQVLLGKGNGTFQPPVHYSFGDNPVWTTAEIAVADFNGDGYL